MKNFFTYIRSLFAKKDIPRLKKDGTVDLPITSFPLRIRYTDTKEEKIVQSSKGIAHARGFVVLETNVKDWF